MFLKFYTYMQIFADVQVDEWKNAKIFKDIWTKWA